MFINVSWVSLILLILSLFFFKVSESSSATGLSDMITSLFLLLHCVIHAFHSLFSCIYSFDPHICMFFLPSLLIIPKVGSSIL